jgi:hypothetical protein
VGAIAKVIARTFEVFGATGVCVVVGGFVAVVVIHTAMKNR